MAKRHHLKSFFSLANVFRRVAYITTTLVVGVNKWYQMSRLS